MKIKREVNGVQMEFELTEHELFDAHRAQEHIWDVHYIEGMFGSDERLDEMGEDEKKEALDDIAWDYRERLNDAEVKDEFEIASEAFENYFEEREAQKGNDDMTTLEHIIGYAGAKEIIDGFQFSGDWEMDAIGLSNALQEHYWEDVGIFNDGIREAIAAMVNQVILEKYPGKRLVVGEDGMLFEDDGAAGGRYEIEVTIDVVGGDGKGLPFGQELSFKMAGNDLEEMQKGILPAVQKTCAEQGYLDNQIVVGILIEENGEWFDSDEETFDLGELNVWICSYKDSLGYLDNGDNVTDILVPKAWLLEKLKAEGVTDIEGWFEEYTADNTDRLARDAVSEGVVLSCADKRISCVLGLGESFLQTNDYGKRLAEHMREIYRAAYDKGDYLYEGTDIIPDDKVRSAEDAVAWCLLTYGDRALQEVQEWADNKGTSVYGFFIEEVLGVLKDCFVPAEMRKGLEEEGLSGIIEDALERCGEGARNQGTLGKVGLDK